MPWRQKGVGQPLLFDRSLRSAQPHAVGPSAQGPELTRPHRHAQPRGVQAGAAANHRGQRNQRIALV